MEYKERFDHVMINENLDEATQELINVVNELKEGVLNGS
jgi:guanylate kinase